MQRHGRHGQADYGGLGSAKFSTSQAEKKDVQIMTTDIPRKLVLMEREHDSMFVPQEKVQSYLADGWKELSRPKELNRLKMHQPAPKPDKTPPPLDDYPLFSPDFQIIEKTIPYGMAEEILMLFYDHVKQYSRHQYFESQTSYGKTTSYVHMILEIKPPILKKRFLEDECMYFEVEDVVIPEIYKPGTIKPTMRIKALKVQARQIQASPMNRISLEIVFLPFPFFFESIVKSLLSKFKLDEQATPQENIFPDETPEGGKSATETPEQEEDDKFAGTINYRHEKIFKEAMEIIRNDPSLNLGQIASIIGMSPKTLTRILKKHKKHK